MLALGAAITGARDQMDSDVTARQGGLALSQSKGGAEPPDWLVKACGVLISLVISASPAYRAIRRSDGGRRKPASKTIAARSLRGSYNPTAPSALCLPSLP